MRIFVKYLSKFSGFLFLLFLIGIWTFISSGPEWSSQYLFPSPKAVLTALFNSREELLRSAWSSLLKLVPAYFAAAVVGISLGIVSGSVPWFADILFVLYFHYFHCGLLAYLLEYRRGCCGHS